MDRRLLRQGVPRRRRGVHWYVPGPAPFLSSLPDSLSLSLSPYPDNLESLVAASPPSEGRLAELTQIWEECTRLEIGFWDGAMNLILPEVEGGEPLKSQA